MLFIVLASSSSTFNKNEITSTYPPFTVPAQRHNENVQNQTFYYLYFEIFLAEIF